MLVQPSCRLTVSIPQIWLIEMFFLKGYGPCTARQTRKRTKSQHQVSKKLN